MLHTVARKKCSTVQQVLHLSHLMTEQGTVLVVRGGHNVMNM